MMKLVMMDVRGALRWSKVCNVWRIECQIREVDDRMKKKSNVKWENQDDLI